MTSSVQNRPPIIVIHRCPVCGHHEGETIQAGCCPRCGKASEPIPIRVVEASYLDMNIFDHEPGASTGTSATGSPQPFRSGGDTEAPE